MSLQSENSNIVNNVQSPQPVLSQSTKNYIVDRIIYTATNSPEKLLELQHSERFHKLIKLDPTLLPTLLNSLRRAEYIVKERGLDTGGKLLIDNFTRLNQFDGRTFEAKNVLEHAINDLSEEEVKAFYNQYIGSIPKDRVLCNNNFKDLIQKKGLSSIENNFWKENNYEKPENSSDIDLFG